MTSPTHGIIAFIICMILKPIGLELSIIISSIAGIAHHLITDRLVFEYGPWYDKGNISKIAKNGLFIVAAWLVYVFIIYKYQFGLNTLWLLIPVFVAILPDIVGVKFPFHKNTQTVAGTLNGWKTALVELGIVLCIWLGLVVTVDSPLAGKLAILIAGSLLVAYLFGKEKKKS